MKDMIGIKIPNGSNLGARLKALAKARRMQYWELLSEWLDQSESGLNVEMHQNFAPVGVTREKEKEDELEARIMARIEERISALLANPKPTEPHSLIEATTAPAASAGKAGKKEVLERILALHSEGHSARKIAELLQSEGIPTLSGKGKWSGGTIQKLLQKTGHSPI
jgi:hypothetical protein